MEHKQVKVGVGSFAFCAVPLPQALFLSPLQVASCAGGQRRRMSSQRTEGCSGQDSVVGGSLQ